MNNANQPLSGILIIDKPEGFTSFDACAKMRRIAGQRKIGHTGTLDPMATGVMVILLGSATRAAELIPVHDKRYTAGFRLGMTTDTLDITGQVQSRCEAHVEKEQLEQTLEQFRGTIDQLPPMYSAVHSDGRRLYELAREGKTVERTARKVTIHALELLDYDPAHSEGTLDISCSKGTYIRSLIDDIGQALGCGGVMTSLRRTAACGFTLDDALTIEQAQELAAEGELASKVIPVERVFEAMLLCRITEKQAVRYFNGGELDLERVRMATQPEDGDLVRVSSAGKFIGLGRIDKENGLLWPHRKF